MGPSIFIFIILLFFGFQACQSGSGNQQEAMQPTDQISVSGKIENPKADTITLEKIGPRTDFQTSIKLDSQNYFKGTLPITQPRYLKFTHGNEYGMLFAEPGDSLHWTLNTEQFDETLELSGTKAAENTYLVNSVLREDTIFKGAETYRNIYAKKPDSFNLIVDSLQQLYMDELEALGSKEVAGSFLDQEEVKIKSQFYEMKERYPIYYSRLNDGEEIELNDGFYDYREQINLSDPSYLSIPNYKDYVDAFMSSKVKDYSDQEAYKDTSRTFLKAKVIQESFDNDTIKGLLVESQLKRMLQIRGPKKAQPLTNLYETLPQRPEYQEEIEDLKADWAAIKNGKQAPSFAYPDMNGDTVRLSDFKGSYVYIDAWATWCGPCKKEIPHLKKLHDSLRNQNVEIVSISLDKAEDKAKWETMVKDKSLKGHQLFANGEAFDSKLVNDYVIYSIPRFIIIGPEGTIVDRDAPRPSQDAQEKLEALLDGEKEV